METVTNMDSSDRDRDVKEERDERRENGTNGDDRKERERIDSPPPPAHDDLDVAE